MKPTDTLKAEHRVIEQVLEVTYEAAKQLLAGRDVDPDLFWKAADFFRNYADRLHHGKEEQLLFARLVEKGLTRDGGPIGVMLAEHDAGRAYVRGMAAAAKRLAQGDAVAGREAAKHALAFVELLTAHIHKEDNILFPLADRVLTPGEQAELRRAFDLAETELMDQIQRELYQGLAHELRREFLAIA
jgi:hemerythrin-like domain-containing protein